MCILQEYRYSKKKTFKKTHQTPALVFALFGKKKTVISQVKRNSYILETTLQYFFGGNNVVTYC